MENIRKKMNRYIGTKKIGAIAMTRGEYNNYRGWTIPENENPTDEGFLVEYGADVKPNDSRHKGYITWTPKQAFEDTYRDVHKIDFGHALELLKMGYKVAREGWNGKGMYIALQQGSTIKPSDARGGVAKCLADEGFNNIDIFPHIDMRTADGGVCVGWLASQTDMLANDWCIVDND